MILLTFEYVSLCHNEVVIIFIRAIADFSGPYIHDKLTTLKIHRLH